MTSTAASTVIGLIAISTNAEIFSLLESLLNQSTISAVCSEITFENRTIFTDEPSDNKSVSACDFWRPYSVVGLYADSIFVRSVAPSKTRLLEIRIILGWLTERSSLAIAT